MRALRQIVEAVVCWPLLLAFVLALAFLLVVFPRRVLSRRRDVVIRLRRWGAYASSGLKHARLAWWVLFQHDGAWTACRYLLILELFGIVNLAAPIRRPHPSDRRRILVVKFGHFGDTLHAVPMLRALREAYPSVQLDMVVGPWCEDLARRIPYVNRVHVFSPAITSMNRGIRKSRRSWFGEIRFLLSLRRIQYDLQIVTYRTGLVDCVMLEGVYPREWLGPVPDQSLYPISVPHIPVAFDHTAYDAERLLRMLTVVGIDQHDARLEYWTSDADEHDYKRLLERRGLGKGGWLVLCPGSGWSGKNWDVRRFAAIADRWASAYRTPILICGGPDEKRLADRVVDAMAHDAVNLAGNTSWGVLACIIREARLLVGNDSGPMHLAAVYETPSVTLWGPTDPAKWAPRGPMHRMVRRVASCPGCLYWHPSADCVRDNDCMRKISVEEVFEAMQDLRSLSVDRNS